jgi:hypothetical protein
VQITVETFKNALTRVKTEKARHIKPKIRHDEKRICRGVWSQSPACACLMCKMTVKIVSNLNPASDDNPPPPSSVQVGEQVLKKVFNIPLMLTLKKTRPQTRKFYQAHRLGWCLRPFPLKVAAADSVVLLYPCSGRI